MTRSLKLVPHNDPPALPLHLAPEGLYFNDALDRAPFPCVRINARGVVEAANPAACDLLQLSLHRRGQPVLAAFLAAQDLAKFFLYVREVHASLETQRAVVRMRRRDGTELSVQLEGRQLTGAAAPCALVSLTDITQQAEAEQCTLLSEARLRSLLEALPDAVFVVDCDCIIDCNPAAKGLAGYDPVGQPFSELICSQQRSLVASRLDTAPAPDSVVDRHELVFVATDGERRTTETLWLPMSFDGRVARLCVARDRTDQRAMEANLAHSDRLATAGVLAAGVAHELNNPLTYVTMNVGELADTLAGAQTIPPERCAELAELAVEARDGARRMARIVSDLRGLARVGDALGPVDLNDVVDRVLALARAQIPQHATVVLNLGQAPPVTGDDGRLTQVVLNLLLNATQALPAEGGRVEISTAASRTGVTLTVRDNGCGIDDSVADRLFEPFVTTKEVGAGTGLGLYVCHQYIAECGGTIQVTSERGQGATFTVTLAVHDNDPLPESVEPTEEPESAAATTRILVIDDEAGIRRALGNHLRRVGEVVLADGLGEAREILASGEHFDAILCDLLMPGGGGRDLHAFVATARPELMPCLGFMTGGAVDRGDKMFLEQVDPPCLRKPFTTTDVAAFVVERIEVARNRAADQAPPLEAPARV